MDGGQDMAALELGNNPNALSLRRPFDPAAHDLEPSFRLTRFADLKGRGCKVPQEILFKLLEGIQNDDSQDDPFMQMAFTRIGRAQTKDTVNHFLIIFEYPVACISVTVFFLKSF
jgi:hypothetical protein